MFYSDILTISAKNQPNQFSRFYKLIAKHTYRHQHSIFIYSYDFHCVQSLLNTWVVLALCILYKICYVRLL